MTSHQTVGIVLFPGSTLSTLNTSMSEYYDSAEETADQPDLQEDKFAAARLDGKEWHRWAESG